MLANLPFLVLDLSLNVVDGIGGLHLKGDSLASQSLHENLHTEERLYVRRRLNTRSQDTYAASNVRRVAVVRERWWWLRREGLRRHALLIKAAG